MKNNPRPLMTGAVTEPRTPHQPTHRRTLSGRLIPRSTEPPMSWHELLMDVGRKQEAPRERLGEFYQNARHVVDPLSLTRTVCSLCGQETSAKECRKNETDFWDAHAPARYNTNRLIRRRSGQTGRYSANLALTLGTAWSKAHGKAKAS